MQTVQRDNSGYQLVQTRLQKSGGNSTVQCHLCLWRCKLGHGQRGFCQAHVNRHGTLYNLSYGILSAIDIGPIEAKPVRHYRPGTRIMSVGSYGCSFRCPGCHNLDISWGVTALDDLARGQSRAAFISANDLVQGALQHGVQGIAFTYSEPAVWLEYVMDVSKAAHAAGLYTVYVTNSFVTDEALELMAPSVDVLCSDIKSLEAGFYRDICKVANVEDVLLSIYKAHQLGIHVETRTNIIPGKNDSPAMLRDIARWIHNNLGEESPWHITRFFPAYKLAHLPETPAPIMWQAHDLARAVGLKNVYVYDDKGCDCATHNLPIETYFSDDREALATVKKCSASCCGDDGILLKKYET
ncbi:MAG: radical SAM protein [Gammaproteobacteria bacterium]|nr:radical SAM protein [Gammaproteobacteria bacterium]